MIAGTVCRRCIEAVCLEYPVGRVVLRYTVASGKEPGSTGVVRDVWSAFEIALDTSKAMPVHACDELIQDPMGGFWGCACVHRHSA